MSYNESMGSSSNYPLMSQSEWDAAPFNEIVIPDQDFNVTCSQTLSKTVRVKTNSYLYDCDEGNGPIYPNTDNVVWSDEYNGNNYHTPLQLIGLLKQVLEENMGKGLAFKNPKFTEDLIKECDDWIDDDTEFIKE